MININWKVRFRNPTFIIAFSTLVISFFYKLLGIMDVVPSVTEGEITQIVFLFIDILAGIGIIQDPTTKGIGDSQQALKYEVPKDDTTTKI